MSEIPNQNEILHYLELNEAACGFEAQTYAIRGYGAFDRTTTQIPDPIYIKVAAWLRELTETPSSLAQAAAEVERLKDILFRLYNVCGIMVFRPDQGQPHPMPDGVYDRTMAEANDALRDYTPSSAALSAPAPDEVVLRVRCVQNYPDLPVWEVYVGKIYIGIIVWRDGYYAIRTIYIAGATDNVQYPTLAAAQAALVEWAQCRRTSTA